MNLLNFAISILKGIGVHCFGIALKYPYYRTCSFLWM